MKLTAAKTPNQTKPRKNKPFRGAAGFFLSVFLLLLKEIYHRIFLILFFWCFFGEMCRGIFLVELEDREHGRGIFLVLLWDFSG